MTVALASCGGTGQTHASSAADTVLPKNLTVAFSAKIVTLDPDLASNIPDVSVLHLIAGTLYRHTASGQVIPELATTARVGNNGLTYTFTLRPNLKFSDGTPLTAADVAATMERARNDPNNAFATDFTPIAKVTAPTTDTVVFHLKTPYPDLPAVLAEPQMMVLPPRALVPKTSFFTDPVSAGPYELQSWGSSDTAVMVANPHYWGKQPPIPAIRFVTVPDYNNRIAQVQSGTIDFGFDIPANELPAISGQAHPQVAHLFGFNSLTPNNDAKPLDQLKVRKAISLALDRARLARVAWRGLTSPLTGFWPATMSGYYDPPGSSSSNDAAARADLRGTSCADGCTISLLYTPAYAWEPVAALLVQSDLSKIGIKVTLDETDLTTYDNNEAKGHFQLLLVALYDYLNVPDDFLAWGLSPTINGYYSGYHSGVLNRLIAETDQATGAARARALTAINRLFLTQVPYMNLVNEIYVSASRWPASVVQLGSTGVIDVPPDY